MGAFHNLTCSVATVLTALSGCGASVQTESGSVDLVVGDRHRTCPGGCAEGTVCDELVLSCVAEPGAPTLRSPIAGARTTGKPLVTWTDSPEASDSLIEICTDRDCTNVVRSLTGAGEASLTETLPLGVYFVRGVGRTLAADGHLVRGAVMTTPRAIFSSGRDASSRQPLGRVDDFDGDGQADVFRRESSLSLSTSAVSALSVRLAATKKQAQVLGGWFSNGVGDSAFGAQAFSTLDTDGDGRSEIMTIQQERVSQGYYGSPLPANPIRVQRIQLGADNQTLPIVQNLDVTLPPGQSFVDLIPLGDVDLDGFADIGFVRRLPSRLTSGQYGGTLEHSTGLELEILYGGPAGLGRPTVVDFVLDEGDQPFGWGSWPVLNAIGDINGDGYPELALGVMGPDPANRTVSAQGHFVAIFAGGSDAAYTTELGRIGRLSSLVGLGDLDGDGLADFGGVQEPAYQFNPPSYGPKGFEPAQLIIGLGSSGVSSTSVYALSVATNGCLNHDWMDAPGCPFSGSVTGAADFDADGFSDVVLAANNSNTLNYGGGGRALLFYGSATGLASQPAQEITSPNGPAAPFPRGLTSHGNLNGAGGDELELVSGGYKTGIDYGAPTVATRRDVFGGPRGAMVPVSNY